MIKLLDRLVHMGQNANLRLFGQSSKVLKLLSRKDRVIFWGLVTLRFLVNLLDLAGIALLALAVNFLIADPNTKSFFSPFFELLSLKTDASGSKLPALFAIGLIVVTTFIVKAVASLLLMAKSAEQISRLEVKFAQDWLLALTDSRGAFNAIPLKEDIAYVVTAGSHSIFQRTLVSLSTVFSEAAALLATFGTLCLVQPFMALGVFGYFAAIGWFLQAYAGKESHKWAKTYSQTHVSAVRTVRESIENEKILYLSGQKNFFDEKFRSLKQLSSKSQVRITVVNNFPRYAVETALVIGAFGLAGAAFMLQTPLAAATTLTFFLTSATRMTPSLLNVIGATSAISSAIADTQLTESLLSLVGIKLGGGKIDAAK